MTIALILLALLLVPVAAPAQTVSKAGVVTTLEGNVTARRVALPDPVPLKFKDDVLLQDTITTGDKALARMLLGGKAVVTVRERSVLTITEVPGRSTIELANGKFALAVARERMRPGEEIQIRTPNAIAGVRGTVVITEVLRQGAQTSGVPAVVTNFYVLRGTILAQRLDPSSGLPSGAPLSVGAMESYSGAGAAQPRVAPIPPEQVAQITSGLQPTGPKAGSEAGQEQAKSQAMQATLGLLGALTGGAMDSTLAQAIVAPPATANLGDLTSPIGPPVVVPINPPFEQGSIPCDAANPTPGCGTTGLAGLANLPPRAFTIVGPLTAAALEVLLEGLPLSQPLQFTGPLTVPAGTSLKKFKGTTVSTTRVPLVTLRNASIVQGGSDDLIGADADAAVFLAGSLAEVIDSIVVTGGAFFGVRGGTVVSTETTPFIFFDPVSLTTADSLIALTGGNLALAGALFQDVGGTLNLGSHLLLVASANLVGTGADALIQLADTTVTTGSNLIQVTADNGLPATISLLGSLVEATNTAFNVQGGSFFRMRNGVTLTQTGASPLFRLTGVTAHPTASFVQLTSGTAASPQLSLGGQLLVAKNAALSSGDPTGIISNFVGVLDGSTVTSATTLPFLSFEDSSVDTSANLVSVRRSRAGQPSRLTLGGPLLLGINSLFNHTSLGFAATFGTGPATCCSGFFIAQGGELVSTTASALIQLIGSTFIGADAQTGGAFFVVTDTFGGAPAAELVASGRVTLAGPLLHMTNSTVTTLFDLLAVTRATFSSSTTSPLVTLAGSTLGVSRVVNPLTGIVTTNPIFTVISGTSAASLSLAGALLSASASVISAGELVLVLNFLNGATLSSTTAAPLFQLDGTTMATTKPIFVNTGFSVFSALTCPATGCVGVAPDGTFATMALKGPLLSASNGSSVSSTSSLVFVGNGGQIVVDGSTDPLISLAGGTHNLATSLSAIFDLRGRAAATALENADGVVLDLGIDEAIRHGGAFFETSAATVNTREAYRLDTVLVQASAPLLNLKPGSNLTSVFDALDLAQKAKLTSIGPVVKLDGANLTVNFGALVSVRNGSLMRVTGDFLSLSNASTLNLQAGAVLNVTGNSVVNITGAFVNFGGTGGNAINVTNGSCGGPCTVIGGLNVNLIGGAVAGNVSIAHPIKNGSLGAINAAANSAVISVSGPNSKVTISGN